MLAHLVSPLTGDVGSVTSRVTHRNECPQSDIVLCPLVFFWGGFCCCASLFVCAEAVESPSTGRRSLMKVSFGSTTSQDYYPWQTQVRRSKRTGVSGSYLRQRRRGPLVAPPQDTALLRRLWRSLRNRAQLWCTTISFFRGALLSLAHSFVLCPVCLVILSLWPP